MRAFVMILMVLICSAAFSSRAFAGQPKTERGALTYHIVMKWSRVVQGRYRRNLRQWAEEMIPRFQRAPIAHLRNAAAARTFEAMNDALLGKPLPLTQRAEPVLGQFEKDFIFTPVPPCRIADTRLALGPLSADQTRVFQAVGPSFAAQGGSDSTCGLPVDPAALMMNVTVVDPLAPGYLTVYITGQTRPLASSLNYATGQIINNQVLATLVNVQAPAQNSTFSLYTFSSTHVVIDVVGYFDEAKRTSEPLDCIGYPSNFTIPASSPGTNAILGCPINYSLTSIACNSSFNPDVTVIGSDVISSGVCFVRNNTASIQSITVTARCCRQVSF
ncbi:MAG: hypothetical protein E6Q88_14035 [Lysobacteraceae bacterium]|nr:MAG: hypothetical protein E6Q88_14035 [Xanthomonadaceae bacterium]